MNGTPTEPPIKKGDPRIKELKGRLEFDLACSVLQKARAAPWNSIDSVWVIQQLALCTYKDEELLPGDRFATALKLLDEIGLHNPDGVDPAKIDPSTLPETLGLGGGVYKRKWELDGQLENLQQALVFYLAAWRRDPELDMGYGGVNAAFVLDVLASRAKVIAQRSGTKPVEFDRLRSLARELREEMERDVPKFAAKQKSSGKNPGIDNQYWYLVTMAETYFGLGRYKDAGEWLKRAREAPAPAWEQATAWELQTTFRQLVMLARVQGLQLMGEGAKGQNEKDAKAALDNLLGEDSETALSCYRGRVGLGLSGGGFRASLFHIGVLARLAETDVLRSVEALSTVSGGSIVGAHYYLKMRDCLRRKPDATITLDDYVTLVREVMEEFLAGVQKNLRTRALSSLIANFKMLFQKYSSSHRMGELYEKHLYARVKDDHVAGEYRTMPQLLVKPAVSVNNGAIQADENFKPKFSNWRRRAKVPVLLLNSTSLNSGHSWHFTARWMGEAPGVIGQEVDVNRRYRRLWYEQAPSAELEHYRMGYAVAASACVPGLFQPLVLKDLYQDSVVRLVDGGVHDNQGVGALLNESCTLIFCSDASGQMADAPKPGDGVLGVVLRSNSVLQSRVREAGYQDLKGRVDGRSLQGLFFIHLKKGLEAEPLDWIRCQDPTEPSNPCPTTDYGVDKDVQMKLANIRTDLDSFTEVEAYSLMLSGYLMTESELKKLDKRHQEDGESGTWGDFDVDAPRRAWPFLQLEPLLSQAPKSSPARDDLGLQLKAAASPALKIWQLSPALKAIAAVLGIAGLAALAWWLYSWWDETIVIGPYSFSFEGIVLTVALTLAAVLVPAFKWLRPTEAVRGYLGKAAVAVAGFVVSNIHLWTFDKMYLSRGKLKRLLQLK